MLVKSEEHCINIATFLQITSISYFASFLRGSFNKIIIIKSLGYSNRVASQLFSYKHAHINFLEDKISGM